MSNAKVVIQKFTPRMKGVWGEPVYIEKEILKQIEADLFEIEAATEDEFIEAAKDADAILSLGGGIKLSRKIIESLDKCKIIALPSVGFDSVDIPAATDKGIWVSHTPDVFIEEVADHTMTLLLASWRRLIAQDKLVRTDKWVEARPMLNQYPRLNGQTIGFISFGNIPKAVSKRVKPFGMNMLAFDPFVHELGIIEYGVEPVAQLSELLSRSDYVSAHLPLSKQTLHMISDAEFKQMKSTAVFLNTGRGNTVDEPALIKALKEGEIAFAGLDVFEIEPINTDNPLLKMDNVILTAHAASASARMPVEARRRAAREAVRTLQGQAPISPVNRINPS